MQTSDWSMAIGRDKSGLEIQRELSGGLRVTTERDRLGRVTEQSIFSNNAEKGRMRFHWDMGNRLLRKTNLLTGESVHFDYDPWDNLFRADYKGGSEVESIYKAPDAIGNLFRTEERKDRKYGKGGRLLEDKKFSYHYDSEGNLVLKCRLRPENMATPLWQEGDWAYEWQGNGMLRSVKRPDGETVSFEYDPLGRRISKTYKDKTTRWVWDGNVPLHEWTEEENVTTWLFEEGTFIPVAKIVGDKSYSIITDYLGTPTEMYNSDGEKTWSAELDIYGCVRNFVGRSLGDCPFRYQGQYEDEETGLYYNRFRYYSPDEGMYISQDPIGLLGGLKLYGYVKDINSWIDILGLSGTGGAYMFGFASGDMYIGKGEVGRMNQSISTRSTQVSKMGGDNTLIGKAHISTGGNNDLGKMVEYKAMYDAGFEPGRGGVPDGYLNRHMSGKSTWDANPHLQDQATELAKKLRADYDADVKARQKARQKAKGSHH